MHECVTAGGAGEENGDVLYEVRLQDAEVVADILEGAVDVAVGELR